MPRVERRAQSLGAWLTPLAVVLAAALPRVLNLGVFATMDEVNFWFARSELFLNALRSGNFAATAITDHPGATTMWLGAASILLRDALTQAGLSSLTPQMFIGLYELPISLVNSVAVGVGYLLLREIVPRAVAVLAALLWALDPFLIGFNRVLHVDGLAGTFMMLSLIAACRYWFHAPRRRDLVLSGVFAGLAIVTKSPALILGPTVAVMAFAAARVDRERIDVGWLLRSLIVWGIAMALAAALAWPAVWAAPLAAYEQIRIGFSAEGTQPHQLGNYFLGRSDPAPGFLFYPVAIALRLTPISLIGLLALPLAWRRLPLSPASRRSLASMTWFVVLFTFAMSLFAKKFNRYIAPAFPALDLLAAPGLVWLGASLAVALRARGGWARVAQPLVNSVVVLLAAVNVAWWHPYEIVGYNQLLGGAQAGAWAFKTGWGEGMNLAADWLNAQPNITQVLTITSLKTGLQTYLRPGAQSIQPPVGPLPPKSGYVVIYVNDAQLGPSPAPFDQFEGKVQPLTVIRIYGVDYVWIYEAPPEVATRRDARFGSDAALYGLTSPQNPRVGTTLDWVLAWRPQQPPADGTMLFAHLIGPDGKRYAQVDLPFTAASFDPLRYRLLNLPLAVPADAPAGRYQLAFGLYTPDGQRLTLDSSAAADPALDGPNALLLDQIDLAAP